MNARLAGATLGMLLSAGAAGAQTAFTYQARLDQSGVPADGAYNLVFTLWNAPSGGGQIGAADNEPATAVTDGLFTVTLNDLGQFGPTAFSGDPRWIQASVNGTALLPRQPLTVAPYAAFAFDSPSGGGGNFWAANGSAIHKTNSGGVGIGTTTPQAPLEVRASADSRMRVSRISPGPFVSNGPAVLELLSANVGSDQPYGTVRFLDSAAAVRGAIEYGQTAGLLAPSGMRFVTEGVTRMAVGADGKVGIGTIDPDVPLHILGGTDTTLAAGRGYLVIGNIAGPNMSLDNNEIMGRNNGQPSLLALNAEGGTVTLVQGGLGNVGIGLTSPTAKLHVSTDDEQLAQFNQFGNEPGVAITSLSTTTNFPALTVAGFSSNVEAFRVTGTASVSVLKITGADVAEKFRTSELDQVTPGTVMEIDPDHAGLLRVACGAYNQRVAGVVSGAGDIPMGAILGNLPGHEDAPAVALSGRVWVRCDAGGGAICPGDLLTTSKTPGHAMRATDAARSHGAVIGKAMTPLADGCGLVLVLVNLH